MPEIDPLPLVDRLLDSSRLVSEIVRVTLGEPSSRADREDVLPGTLAAFFRAGECETAAAALLAVQRSTVGRRLARLQQQTGLDLHDPDDWLLLRLAERVLTGSSNRHRDEHANATSGRRVLEFPGVESPAWLDAALGEFRDRIGEIAVRIVSTYRCRIPAYGLIQHPKTLEELENAAIRNLHALVQTVERGAPPSAGEIQTLGALGRRRGMQGLGVTDLLLAHDIGGQIAIEELCRVFEAHHPTHDERRWIDQTTSMLREQGWRIRRMMARTHQALERESRARSASTGDALRILLADEIPDDDQAAAASSGEGHQVVIIGGYGEDVPAHGNLVAERRLAATIQAAVSSVVAQRAIACETGRVVVAAITQGPEGDRHIATALRKTLEHLPAAHRRGVFVAVGGPEPGGTSGVGSSYFQAFEVAELLAHHPGRGVMTYRQGLPALLVHQEPEHARALLNAALGPLNLSDDALLPVLEAFLSSSGARAAARRLGISHTTLYQRLSRISQLTGLNPRHSDARLAFGLALVARWFFPPSLQTM